MQFTEKHFVYDGINSRRYGLFFAHIDTEPFKKISGTPTYQKNFYNNTKTNSIVGTKWDESPISTEVEILSENPISKKELREIEKWLFNRSQYCKLYIDKREDEDIEVIDGEEKQCYIECLFYETEVIEYTGGIYGFKATMELSSSFALQDSIIKTINSNSNDEYTEVVVNVDTDDGDYVYPIITFDNESDCNKNKIINMTDEMRNFCLSEFKQIYPSTFREVSTYLENGSVYALHDSGYFDKMYKDAEYLNHNYINYFQKGRQIYGSQSFKIISDSTDFVKSRIIIQTDKGYSIHFGISSSPYDGVPPDFVFYPEIKIEYESGNPLLFIGLDNVEKSPEFINAAANGIKTYSNNEAFTIGEDLGAITNMSLNYSYYYKDYLVRDVVEFNDLSDLEDNYKEYVSNNALFSNFSCLIGLITSETTSIYTEFNFPVYYYDGNSFAISSNKTEDFNWSSLKLYTEANVNVFTSQTIEVNSSIQTILDKTDANKNYNEYLANQNFPRLCNGDNVLHIYGHSIVNIEYQQKRFLR